MHLEFEFAEFDSAEAGFVEFDLAEAGFAGVDFVESDFAVGFGFRDSQKSLDR